MNNSFFSVANGSRSTAHTLPLAKAGFHLKASVGLITILCLTVFGAGCNTNSSTDKTTRTDSVSRSSGQSGDKNGGMTGDDNRPGNDENGGMMGNGNRRRGDTMRREMHHRGMGGNGGGMKLFYQPIPNVSPPADTVAPMTAQPANDDGGMAMIHHGMDMVKSGKAMMDKGQVAKDKAMASRGMSMMDKGMDMMDMGKDMMKKEKPAMPAKKMGDDMNMGMDMMDKGKAMTGKGMTGKGMTGKGMTGKGMTSMGEDATARMGMDMMDKGMGMMNKGMDMTEKCCGGSMKKTPMKKPSMKKGSMKKAPMMDDDM